jgi:hypothetical protein
LQLEREASSVMKYLGVGPQSSAKKKNVFQLGPLGGKDGHAQSRTIDVRGSNFQLGPGVESYKSGGQQLRDNFGNVKFELQLKDGIQSVQGGQAEANQTLRNYQEHPKIT